MLLKWKKRLREVPKRRVDNAELRLEDGRILPRARRAGIQQWLVERGHAEPEFHWRAEIVRNNKVGGKVRQTHIADLGGITTSAISLPCERAAFWARAKERLDRLHNRSVSAFCPVRETLAHSEGVEHDIVRCCRCQLPQVLDDVVEIKRIDPEALIVCAGYVNGD